MAFVPWSAQQSKSHIIDSRDIGFRTLDRKGVDPTVTYSDLWHLTDERNFVRDYIWRVLYKKHLSLETGLRIWPNYL
ncbi:hypothetical protein PILCRDRAFT_820214 [Piloderma croceum F 1598]|uniref:Uncharacterized protein n=1 Tax=Piloderma croceum (strain F 1598) TaxID=765440 RepID=A0A0C3FRL4_PILCF|nr:hypothetical protein PILCRDRAFT_820214 [Piloderma croceum F 1598]